MSVAGRAKCRNDHGPKAKKDKAAVQLGGKGRKMHTEWMMPERRAEIAKEALTK